MSPQDETKPAEQRCSCKTCWIRSSSNKHLIELDHLRYYSASYQIHHVPLSVNVISTGQQQQQTNTSLLMNNVEQHRKIHLMFWHIHNSEANWSNKRFAPSTGNEQMPTKTDNQYIKLLGHISFSKSGFSTYFCQMEITERHFSLFC